jgi:hypothetical protein
MIKDKTAITTIIVSFVVLVLFLSLIYITFFGLPPKQPYSQINRNTGLSTPINPTVIEEKRRSEIISGVIDLTPYYGKYFSLTFDYNDYVFNLYLDPNHQKEGGSNFDSFLKQNGVLSRTWINNLKIINK